MEEIVCGFERDGRTGSRAPSLLLHSCCAPCSSSVITTLADFFRITVFYYNPNIDEKDEYEKRAREQERLVALLPTPLPVRFLEGEYRSADFLETAERFADEPEGGARCTFCYGLRLEKTAHTAAEGGFDYFCSTLSVSPLKDAVRINSIGEKRRVQKIGRTEQDLRSVPAGLLRLFLLAARTGNGRHPHKQGINRSSSGSTGKRNF